MKALLWWAAILIAVPLVLSGAYWAHGSLDLLPTSEDHSQVRVVAGFGFALFLALELMVVSALRARYRQ